jgi:hypothetical protein
MKSGRAPWTAAPRHPAPRRYRVRAAPAPERERERERERALLAERRQPPQTVTTNLRNPRRAPRARLLRATAVRVPRPSSPRLPQNASHAPTEAAAVDARQARAPSSCGTLPGCEALPGARQTIETVPAWAAPANPVRAGTVIVSLTNKATAMAIKLAARGDASVGAPRNIGILLRAPP